MCARMDRALRKKEVIGISVWYIVLSIFVFGILIFVHEFGHYLCARLCGVGVNEFAIGMGPKIFGWTSKKTEIKYTIRALPIGGYVSMVGEDEESDREDAFGKRSVWKRILIVIAGPAMNLLLGFLAMLVLVTSSGVLYGTEVDYQGRENVQISDKAGLDQGDIILKIGKVRVHTRNELVYEIRRQGTEAVDVTVRRNGEELVVKDVEFPTVTEGGMEFGGWDFVGNREQFTFGNVMKHTFFRSASTVKMIVDSFVDLITGKYGMEAMSGPVGITQTMGEAAKSGFSSFLYVFVIITVNLGVFNLFPIPALDGGRLLFLLVEVVIRRPLNKNVEGIIHFVGLALMLLLVVFVTFNDILRLF